MRAIDCVRAFAVLAVLSMSDAHTATFEIINENAPGVGFSDNAPANGAAGDNGATSLGEQRLRVIQRAAEIWSEILVSDVPIRVAVRMIDQACTSEGTTLASAGPVSLAINFPGAPRANTAYHIAQANALAGADLAAGSNDINMNFNLALDAGCSATSAGWWYGIDPDVLPPTDRTAMLPVALHEFAHGLGFSAQVNLNTGEYASSSPTVWASHLYDLQSMKHWRVMTAAERAISARNDPYLVWSGSGTNRAAVAFLTGAPALRFATTRGAIDEVTELGQAEFGASYPTAPLDGRIVLVNDGVAAPGDTMGTFHDGCESPFANGQRLAGRIALIDRGLCPFVDKARHAQMHGAIAVLIANNVEGAPPNMAGADPTITIPVVAITRDTGRRLKRGLFRPHVKASLAQTEALAGVAQGCLRMYAPAEAEPGSSVSHFHPAAFPSLLMEPSITRGLFDEVDLTSWFLDDIGWPTTLVSFGTPRPDPCVVRPVP